MPLEVIRRNRGKDVSIFEKLNPFVEKLVGVYKQKKQDEWDNEWMSAMLSDIEIAGSKRSIDASILKKDPPEGYIDTEGMIKFADESINLLTKKEIATGGLTPTAPQVTEGVAQQGETELLPDVKEFNELFQFVSELPTGRIDWTNTIGVFKKRLESGRAMGAASASILNMILGQGVTDQRQKFEQDFDLAAKMKNELYPETEEAGVVFDPEQFKRDNPDMEISGYNSNTGGYTFRRKEEEEGGKLPTSEMGLYLTNREVWQQYQADKKAVKPQPTNDPNYQIVTITDEKGVKTSYYVNKDDPDAQATPVKGLPEGRGTTPAGDKFNIDKFLFGKTGIINQSIQDNLSEGILIDEEVELILKNYKLKKHTLSEEEIKEVELYFEQIGIDPNVDYSVKEEGNDEDKEKSWLQKIFTPTEKSRDKYGYVLGEEKIGTDGKKYKYMGNDEWKPVY